MVIIRKKDNDHDLMKEFCNTMSEAVMKLYDKHFRSKVPINMTPKDEKDYNSSKRCHLCSKRFYPDSTEIYQKVRDHCHFTGKYRGAAHSICNLRARKPDFIPALFHNLEGYDEHLFLPSLAVNGENVTSIPLSEEKHKSISKEILRHHIPGKEDGKTKAFNLRFIDSANFLQSSLQKLAENLPKDGFNYLEKFVGKDPVLKQKGVFPYEYIDSMEKLNETCLPPKEKIFSSLRNEGFSEEDYIRAQEYGKNLGVRPCGTTQRSILKRILPFLQTYSKTSQNGQENLRFGSTMVLHSPRTISGRSIKVHQSRTGSNNRSRHVPYD